MIDIEEHNDEPAIDIDDADDGEETELAKLSAKVTRIEGSDDAPEVGSWWWVKGSGNKPSDYDEPGRKWLACVVEVGSNYAKVKGVRFSSRIGLDDFHKLCTSEGDSGAYIDTKVGFHKTRVRALMADIQKLCHQLGVPMREALAAAEPVTQALALAHGIADVKKYKKALVKAKEKTLPELFEKIREEHKEMAKWMSAELIPAEAVTQTTGQTRFIASSA